MEIYLLPQENIQAKTQKTINMVASENDESANLEMMMKRKKYIYLCIIEKRKHSS